ncbi:YqgE/AlgH family protein [Urechidicola vernalis]|uniref:YqgE/AlgH family protein n=1 Tax=Urechidicola vernalis TaxID=3075600 RepID=A0ABU2Y2P1_9FLAO|nr:YqgE/AlgH family protein [Urechidicola sp. P050]MDT0552086.1 YqgE/AlgH family protein [Urechidicola sp. P050]
MTDLKPIKGRLLVAEPSILNDKSFNRSVVLLTEHNKTGSIGFIMNKPMKYKISDLVPDIDCSFPIYNGGPVSQENLYFIHNVPQLIPDSVKIAENIYWGGDFDSVSKLLVNRKINTKDIRFFLGYAGWEANQLAEELTEDSWKVMENSYPNILTTNDSLWKNKLMELGGEYQIWANSPKNPSLN